MLSVLPLTPLLCCEGALATGVPSPQGLNPDAEPLVPSEQWNPAPSSLKPP